MANILLPRKRGYVINNDFESSRRQQFFPHLTKILQIYPD